MHRFRFGYVKQGGCIMQTALEIKNFKKIITVIFAILILIGAVLCRLVFISANQYFFTANECLEHRFNKDITYMLFEYENEKQGFYISQSEDNDLIISVLKIKKVHNKKYYKLKEFSSSGSLYSVIADWSSMGDFEYFIANDDEFLKKYAKGKSPTYTQTIEYQIDEKKETSVVWLIDKTV